MRIRSSRGASCSVRCFDTDASEEDCCVAGQGSDGPGRCSRCPSKSIAATGRIRTRRDATGRPGTKRPHTVLLRMDRGEISGKLFGRDARKCRQSIEIVSTSCARPEPALPPKKGGHRGFWSEQTRYHAVPGIPSAPLSRGLDWLTMPSASLIAAVRGTGS